jgi:predicted metal-dependent phosphoesterase TrpH
LIDLHTHTTASDGRRTPPDLVAYAAVSGVTVLSVTDHDTVAGCEPAAAASVAAEIEFVPGIEITAFRDNVDVHVLGYFIDVHAPVFLKFLEEQRHRRIERARQMIARLANDGISLDADAILRPGLDDPTKSVGRPWIARALVEGGYAATTGEAFDRWLARGRPAYVPRLAASPEEVLGRIHEAGGVASLAHPGLLRRDTWIPELADAGLDALEAYHIEHDRERTEHYVSLAGRLGLALSGGSDYHADQTHGASAPGSVSLPREAYEQLKRRATRANTWTSGARS